MSTSLIDKCITIDKQFSTWRSDDYIDARKTLLSLKKPSQLQHRSENLDQYLALRQAVLHHKKNILSQEFSQHSSDFDIPPSFSDGDAISDDDDAPLTDWSVDTKTSKSKKELAEAYAFVGMHHIFERAGTAVKKIAFGHNVLDRFAFATSDGAISIADAYTKPQVIFLLTGHTKAVTDFDWSSSNEYILSVSLDCTIRLWNANIGKCIRVISEKSPGLCVAFHPLNNNIFVVGFKNCYLKVFNLSTGKANQRFKTKGAIRSLCFTQQGDLLFVGDEKSTIYIYRYSFMTGHLERLNSFLVGKVYRPITSLSYSSWMTGDKPTPSLLVNACDNSVRLYDVDKKNGILKLSGMFPIAHRKENVKSVFCPLISFRNGACFVSGSEDSEVYIFDLTAQDTQKTLNKLMGHLHPVVDVAWNYDESLLASADNKGTVILWKRSRLENEKKPETKKQEKQEPIINSEDLENILQKLKQTITDEDRMNELKNSIEYLKKKVTCDHVVQFLQCFDFSATKVDLVSLMAPIIADSANYKSILEKFEVQKDKEAVQDIFDKLVKK